MQRMWGGGSGVGGFILVHILDRMHNSQKAEFMQTTYPNVRLKDAVTNMVTLYSDMVTRLSVFGGAHLEHLVHWSRGTESVMRQVTQVLITCVTEDTKDYTITVQDVEGGNDETYNSVEGFIVAFETPMYAANDACGWHQAGSMAYGEALRM